MKEDHSPNQPLHPCPYTLNPTLREVRPHDGQVLGGEGGYSIKPGKYCHGREGSLLVTPAQAPANLQPCDLAIRRWDLTVARSSGVRAGMLLRRWRKVWRCASSTPTQGEALVGGSSSAKLLSAMRSGTHWAGTFSRAAALKMTSTSCTGGR